MAVMRAACSLRESLHEGAVDDALEVVRDEHIEQCDLVRLVIVDRVLRGSPTRRAYRFEVEGEVA